MKTITQIAYEVLDGKWGSGDTRKKKLEAAGYNYKKVQAKVNEIFIAVEVLDGKWGSGDARVKALKKAGYNPKVIQTKVNEIYAARTAVVTKMNAYAKKIADGKYHYVAFSGVSKTHTCPLCTRRKFDDYFGWNCIGFVWSIWHHGGNIPCKCNCFVISDSVAEDILNAKTDAEALKIAQAHVGTNLIEVVRNKNGIPKSKWNPGDTCLLFKRGHYLHTFFHCGDGKIADASSGYSTANQIAIRDYKSYSAKVIIRYTAWETLTRKEPDKKSYPGNYPNINRAKMLVDEASRLAWPSGTPRSKYAWRGGSATPAFTKALDKVYPEHNSWGAAPSKGCSCDVFVGTVVRSSGIDPKFPRGLDEQESYTPQRMFKYVMSYVDMYKKSIYGDVIWYDYPGPGGHVLIRGKDCIYQAGYQTTYGHTTDGLDEIKDTEPKVIIFRPRNYLMKGDAGIEVKRLQHYLIWGGWLAKGQDDSIFGVKTETATKKMQKALNVVADGKVGSDTLKAMRAYKK